MGQTDKKKTKKTPRATAGTESALKPSENKPLNKNGMTGKKMSPTAKRFLMYLAVLVAAGIIGLVIALIKFFGTEKTQRSAQISIEFTYDGAAQNQTPTGEIFSIDGIYQDSILEAAIARAGLEGKYTAKDILNNMIVTGSYPADVIDQIKDYDSLYDFSESRAVSINNYYPTIYTVKLYDDFDASISKTDLENLVKAVAEEYKQYFSNEYIYAFKSDYASDLLSIQSYEDYSQQTKVIKQRLTLLKSYAKEMYEEDSAFRYNGKSFNDVVLKCSELESDALSKAEASIVIDVLTVSTVRLRNQYEYEIKLLTNEKTYKEMNLAELNTLIESYEMDGTHYIGSGDSLVKIDSNSKETYETLIDKKREISERIVEIDSDISRYNEYLEDMKRGGSSTDKKKEDVQDELIRINELVLEQQESFKAMVDAYNESILTEDSVEIMNLRYDSAKLFSASFIVRAVKCAAPLCIIVLFLCSLHAAFIELKRYKKESALENKQEI